MQEMQVAVAISDRPASVRQELLTTRTDRRRLAAASQLAPSAKAELGQFMTPAPIAEFMASLFSPVVQSEIHLLDPGAGVGSLTAAFLQRICTQPVRPKLMTVTAYELDLKLAASLKLTLDDCVRTATAAGIHMSYEIVPTDFIVHSTQLLTSPLFNERHEYTHVITNPPYKKITSSSEHRRLLRSAGIEATNLYAAFIALAVKLLRPNGELVAITPRSFCNGPYFFPLRKQLLSQMSLRHVHTFEARDIAFQDDAVLQENIIFAAVKGSQAQTLELSSSRGVDLQRVDTRRVGYSAVVHPGDQDLIIHLPVAQTDSSIVRQMKQLPHSLQDLGISVSTGPVVDFRLRPFIHQVASPSLAPLIYPAHFQRGLVIWPKINGRKPNAIEANAETRKWLMPCGYYTLTRRFSSKEEKRRIVAAVFDPDGMTAEWIGFENHLNVFHACGRGLPPDVARGLAVYLNSTLVDRYFRQFNGHTQVNASDLRALRYPPLAVLTMLGELCRGPELPVQEYVDQLVAKFVFDGEPPSAPHQDLWGSD